MNDLKEIKDLLHNINVDEDFRDKAQEMFERVNEMINRNTWSDEEKAQIISTLQELLDRLHDDSELFNNVWETMKALSASVKEIAAECD